jgi:hypothetical protein
MIGLRQRQLVYELLNIEKYVRLIADGKKPTRSISLSKEEHRVLLAFRQQAFSINDEALLSRYFSLHQQSVLDLLNMLEPALLKGSKASVELQESLTRILSYLRVQFQEYFHFDYGLPKCLLEQSRKEATAVVERIKAALLKETSGLLNLVVETITGSIAQDQWMTFGRINYIKILGCELEKVSNSFSEEIFAQNICKLLICLNFNSDRFFAFYIKRINNALLKCESLSERIEQLAYYYKICSQEQCSRKLSFCPECTPINVQLLEWITQELEFLRQKQQLSVPSQQGSGNSDYKINFDLSVAQLACLFKVFTETSIVQNKNTSELIRFLAKFVKTKKAETVSFESLRIKFYDVESGTKDAVRKMLQSMLSYMGKS